MKRYITIALIIGISTGLASCIWYEPLFRDLSDFENGYKNIQRWQKRESIGLTDPIQRKKDALECGVINYRGGFLDFSVAYKGAPEDKYNNYIRSGEYARCMRKKGYISTVKIEEGCTRHGQYTGLCDPKPCIVDGKSTGWCGDINYPMEKEQ